MKSVKIKLPFGLNENNDVVHISDVVSGQKCHCVCPGCLSPLIAAKGSKNQHHFKHAVTTECEGGLESAIHLAAKKIITEKKKLTLSECIATVSAMDSTGKVHKQHKIVIAAGTIINLDRVEVEKELHCMKADLLVQSGSRSLIVEIFYRHKVDEEKLLKIKNAKISAIEIDLSDLQTEDVKNWETFWSAINDYQRVQWLHNEGQERAYPKLNKQVKELIDKQEEIYKQEQIRKVQREEKEKAQLVQALDELNTLRSKAHIGKLKEEAENHPLWKIHGKYLNLTWNVLPDYLDIDVIDGDWIFGCDRRIWQTAFYSYFIERKNSQYFFSTKYVDDWLNRQEMCKVPRCAKTVGILGRRYSELLNADDLENLPSSWKSLNGYFNYLCKLDILMYSDRDWQNSGSSYFWIIDKIPDF